MKEEEFWRNYFYRLSLIKQSFDLKDLEKDEGSKAAAKEDKKVKKQSESEMNLEEELG